MFAITLIIGILLLLITSYDFFYTTLSGSGAAIITRFITRVNQKLLRLGVKHFGRRIYNYSGLIINISVFSVWILLIWIGLFLVFTSNTSAIVNDEGESATHIERLYFTGYILSTLGIGNFKPVSAFFELITAAFSFFGFIFFTTSMTYLVSVFSALGQKRSLALSIRSLGKTPEEIVYRLLNQDTTFTRNHLLSLQEKFEKYLVNLQSFPVLYEYGNSKIQSSLNLNLVILDEALSILLKSKEGEKIKNALGAIHTSVSHLLEHMEEKLIISSERLDAPDIQQLRGWEIIRKSYQNDPVLQKRRNILGSLLYRESFEWDDVYRM